MVNIMKILHLHFSHVNELINNINPRIVKSSFHVLLLSSQKINLAESVLKTWLEKALGVVRNQDVCTSLAIPPKKWRLIPFELWLSLAIFLTYDTVQK